MVKNKTNKKRKNMVEKIIKKLKMKSWQKGPVPNASLVLHEFGLKRSHVNQAEYDSKPRTKNQKIQIH